ncbi:MAG: hypothetical protein WA777_01385 [Rhodanobacter sp.]
MQDAQGELHAVRVNRRLKSTLGEMLRNASLAGLSIIALHAIWHISNDLR